MLGIDETDDKSLKKPEENGSNEEKIISNIRKEIYRQFTNDRLETKDTAQLENAVLSSSILNYISVLSFYNYKHNKVSHGEETINFDDLMSCEEDCNPTELYKEVFSEELMNNFLDKRKELFDFIQDKINQGKIKIGAGFLSSEWQDDLDQALAFAYVSHIHDYRNSGEPYINHPIEALKELIDVTGLYDLPSWKGMIFHDIIEDHDDEFGEDNLKEIVSGDFGEDVLDQVLGVTKLKTVYKTDINKIKKQIHEIFKDLRVLAIKCADRIHNLRTINSMSPETQFRVASETLNIYCPLARKFGMRKAEKIMAELSLKIIESSNMSIEGDKSIQLSKISNDLLVNNKEINIKTNNILSPYYDLLSNNIIDKITPNDLLKSILEDAVEWFINSDFIKIKNKIEKIDKVNHKDKDELKNIIQKLKTNDDIKDDLLQIIDDSLKEGYKVERDSLIGLIKAYLYIEVEAEMRERNVYNFVRDLQGEEKEQDFLGAFTNLQDYLEVGKVSAFKIRVLCDDDRSVRKVKELIKFSGEPMDSEEIGAENNHFNGVLGKIPIGICVHMINELKDMDYSDDPETKVFLLDNKDKKSPDIDRALDILGFLKNSKSTVFMKIMTKKNSTINRKGLLVDRYEGGPYHVNKNIEMEINNALENVDKYSDLLSVLRKDIVPANQIVVYGNDGVRWVVGKGITLLEYASNISSRLAANFSYAYVNGERISDFNRVIQDGDSIEIVSNKNKLNMPYAFLDLDQNKKKYHDVQDYLIKEIKEMDHIEQGIDELIDKGQDFIDDTFQYYYIDYYSYFDVYDSNAYREVAAIKENIFSDNNIDKLFNSSLKDQIDLFNKKIWDGKTSIFERKYNKYNKLCLLVACGVISLKDIINFIDDNNTYTVESSEKSEGMKVYIDLSTLKDVNYLDKQMIIGKIMNYFNTKYYLISDRANYRDNNILLNIKLSQDINENIKTRHIIENLIDNIIAEVMDYVEAKS